MTSQLIVLAICLGALLVAAQEEDKQIKPNPEARDISDREILRILEQNSKTLQSIDGETRSISNSQKGIDSKLKVIGQDLAGIGRLEDGLKKLDLATAKNFQLTANGIKELTANIKSAENRTDRAIAGLSRGQQEIKQVLVKVDANQNKYERKLDEVAKSVQQKIAGLDNLLKQQVLKELLDLTQTAKKLEHSQRHIENKVAHLDQLAALSGITATRVQLLEQGVRSLNNTQSRELAAIGHTVHQLGASTWQIDNKLGVLLSTQKNIERALEECKKHQPHHKDYHHERPQHPKESWPEHSYIPDYEHKEPEKAPAKPEYESSYANTDESEYIYQLWYGKDQK